MALHPGRRKGHRVLRHSAWDSLLILLAATHGCALILRPSLLLMALGLWWNSNTIAHNFLHLPFFKSRLLNRCFSAYLSVLLGIPQRLWRDRHLAHHAETQWRLRLSSQLIVESALVGLLWSSLLWREPGFFWRIYWPGWLLGLGLCQLQGHYEHARGTTSHYSRLYNLLFFNDGFHREHHARPNAHWKSLPRWKAGPAVGSRWPPCLRWLEWVSLESLEKLVLRWPFLRNLVLHSHTRAFRKLLPEFREARTVVIVGGGLFPRTALILLELLPNAEITIIDQNADHIRSAVPFVAGRVKFVHGVYPGDGVGGTDLTVIPLSFVGNRRAFATLHSGSAGQRGPAAPVVLIHDWLWRRCGHSAVVSMALLKRINLIRP
jgi:hypothetical protein